MPFAVVYDAAALYPNAQRDLLLRIARHGLVQAKWTEQILDEMTRARLRKHPDLDPATLERLRKLMNGAIADCLVTRYEALIDNLELPDLDDRHVLAAAIKARAQVIVTPNLKDFPASELGKWDIEAKSPDDFVVDQINIDDRIVYACVQEIVNSRRREPKTVEDVLTELENAGMVASVAALRT
ncbi:MAG: PIN domain-containing protein [Actinobacteria bacterium]|nr:PIN domain-containing protein [Actinomycetota bacterium]